LSLPCWNSWRALALPLASGKATARELFQQGKLWIDGDVSVGHRLGFLKGLI
jgi:hypothetical protein